MKRSLLLSFLLLLTILFNSVLLCFAVGPGSDIAEGNESISVESDGSEEMEEPDDPEIPVDPIVIGSDDRIKVTNTTLSPYRAVVRLAYKKNGSTYRATGALIAPNLVLTCGHALYNNGAWATDMVVYPGRNGSYNPYGGIEAASLITYPGWTSVTSYSGSNLGLDLGLIRLKYPIGVDTGWFSLTSNLSTSTYVTLTGYHGDLNSGNDMYKTSGYISSINTYGVASHPLDMMATASGSPIYNNSNQIAAVNIAESNSLMTNYAVVLNAEKLAWINSELNKVTVYRLYNPNTSDHIYTTDINEVKSLVTVGWINDGVGWYAPQTGDPVYRLFNSQLDRHFYTVSLYEKNVLVSQGWTYENVSMYSDPNQTVPIYRLFNSGSSVHVFTMDVNEKNTLVSQGWILEGIGWYALN